MYILLADDEERATTLHWSEARTLFTQLCKKQPDTIVTLQDEEGKVLMQQETHDPENIYNLPGIRQSIEEDRKR